MEHGEGLAYRDEEGVRGVAGSPRVGVTDGVWRSTVHLS